MSGSRRVTVAGHFGEWFQGRLGPGGPVVLVTLPCPALRVTGQLTPGRGLTIYGPAPAALTPKQVRDFAATIGGRLSGRIALRADMPLGGGAGASTAILIALARLSGAPLTDADLAAACVAAEGASDPLTFPEPARHLWASREGRSVATLPPPPRCEIVGGFWGPPSLTRAEDTEFADVADLVPRWAGAAAGADLAAAAAIASESARRNRALRGPAEDPTKDLVRETRALGHVIAHTGSARGLIFPPGADTDAARDALIRAGYRRVLRFRAGG